MHAAIVDAVEPLRTPFEMVFVNDGSRDRTLEIAVGVAREDPRVRIVHFRRNYGQTPAMAAGIEHARGEILVTMDGDLQNDPRDIEHFLAKMQEGYDIVVGWRVKRQDKLISRRIPSQVANWLIGKVTGVAIKDNGCSLKAFRASPDQADSVVFGDASIHSCYGFHCRAKNCGDSGSSPCAPVWAIEIRTLAHLQGAARFDGHQDRRYVLFEAADVVQPARCASCSNRRCRNRALHCGSGARACARSRCPWRVRASFSSLLPSSWWEVARSPSSSLSWATCASATIRA